MGWSPPFLSGVPRAVQQAFVSLAQQLTPAGTIITWAGTSAKRPPGHLLCNGAVVSRAVYRDLFAAIGTTWGGGDGVTTFSVPSLNGGRFLQGASVPGGYGGSSTHNHGIAPVVAAGSGNAVDNTTVDHRPPYADVVFLVKF